MCSSAKSTANLLSPFRSKGMFATLSHQSQATFTFDSRLEQLAIKFIHLS
jgi:hypothetical protein